MYGRLSTCSLQSCLLGTTRRPLVGVSDCPPPRGPFPPKLYFLSLLERCLNTGTISPQRPQLQRQPEKLGSFYPCPIAPIQNLKIAGRGTGIGTLSVLCTCLHVKYFTLGHASGSVICGLTLWKSRDGRSREKVLWEMVVRLR